MLCRLLLYSKVSDTIEGWSSIEYAHGERIAMANQKKEGAKRRKRLERVRTKVAEKLIYYCFNHIAADRSRNPLDEIELKSEFDSRLLRSELLEHIGVWAPFLAEYRELKPRTPAELLAMLCKLAEAEKVSPDLSVALQRYLRRTQIRKA